MCLFPLQVAKELAESLSTASTLCEVNGLKLGRELWAPAMAVLERCQGLAIKKKGKDKCLVARYDTLHALFRTGPGYADKDAPTPPNLVAVCKAYATGPLKDEAATLLQVALSFLELLKSCVHITFSRCGFAPHLPFCIIFQPCDHVALCFFVQSASAGNSSLLAADVRGIFATMRAGDMTLAQSLATAAPTAYPKDPKAFEDNIDVLFMMDFVVAGSIFTTMAGGGSGKALASYVDKFTSLVESGTIQYGMETMVIMVLSSCANDAPELVLPHLDRIYKAFIKLPNADASLAMVVGACGKADGAALKVTAMLGGMLSEPSLSQYTPPMVLSCLVTQTEALGDNYAAMDPFMEKVYDCFDSICVSCFLPAEWFDVQFFLYQHTYFSLCLFFCRSAALGVQQRKWWKNSKIGTQGGP